jgi:hypothetical protein
MADSLPIPAINPSCKGVVARVTLLGSFIDCFFEHTSVVYPSLKGEGARQLEELR